MKYDASTVAAAYYACTFMTIAAPAESSLPAVATDSLNLTTTNADMQAQLNQ